MRILIFLTVYMFICLSLKAQEKAISPSNGMVIDTIPTVDGFYQANDLSNAVPFAYPKINTKNVRFYKRIWRDIDLTEERNYIYATPGASLIEAIMESIKAGNLTPYSPEDDSFKTRLTASQGVARFADSVLVPIFDDEGNQIDAKMTLNEFNPEKVTKFRIKEDLFFDKQRSRLETRIIGIAPLMDISTSIELAEAVGSTPAFWLYFPQLRYTLVKIDVSDPERGLYDMSMDDLFVQRKFDSKIIRESSPSGQQTTQLAAIGTKATTTIDGEVIDGGSLSIDSVGESQLQDVIEIEDKIEKYKKKLWAYPKGIDVEKLDGYHVDYGDEVIEEKAVEEKPVEEKAVE